MHCSNSSGENGRVKWQLFLSKVILALNQPNCNELQSIVGETFSGLDFCQGKSDQDVDQARRKLTEDITAWVKRRDKELTPWTIDKSREVLAGFDRHLQMQKLRGLSDGNRHKATQYLSISVQPGVALPPRSGTVATRQPWVCAQLAVADTPRGQAALLTAEQFAAQRDGCVLDGLGGLIVLHDKAAPGPNRRDLKLDVAARGGLLLTNDVEEQDQEWLVLADQLTDDCLDDILKVSVNIQGRSLALGGFLQGDRVRARRVLGPATIEKVARREPLSVGHAVSPPLFNDSMLGPEHYLERSVLAFQPQPAADTAADSKPQADSGEQLDSRQQAKDSLSEQQLAERQRAVVSAPAGMGKSSLLRSVAARMCATRLGQWTLLCNLSEKKDALRLAGLPISPEECKALLRKLLAVAEGDDGELERSVLESGLEAPGVVALLFDGYDEIHHVDKCGEAFFQLLEWLGKTKAGLWVTTREQSVGKLLDAVVASEAFCIQGLTQDDQHKLWTSLNREFFITKFYLNLACKRFFENPLHTSMFFLVSHRLTKDEHKRDLRLHTLYEKFLEYKLEVYWQREAIGDENIRTVLKRSIVNAHQQLAIMALYAAGWRDFADPVDLSRSEKDLVKDALEPGFGLFRISEEGSVLFVHQTFAEFFASRWIYCKLKDATLSINANLRALLDRVMTKSDSREVRALLEDQLAASTVPPNRWFRHALLPESETFLSVPLAEGLLTLSCFLWRRFRDELSEKQRIDAFFVALRFARIPFVEQALQDLEFQSAVVTQREKCKPPLHFAVSLYELPSSNRGSELCDDRLGQLLRVLLDAGCRVDERDDWEVPCQCAFVLLVIKRERNGPMTKFKLASLSPLEWVFLYVYQMYICL